MVSHVSLTGYCDTGPEWEGGRGAGTTVVCPLHMALLHTDAGCHYCEGKGKQSSSHPTTDRPEPLHELVVYVELAPLCCWVRLKVLGNCQIYLTTFTSRPRIEGLHASHGSMAAANCSYDRKIGGECGERDGNMVRSRHHIIWSSEEALTQMIWILRSNKNTQNILF